MTSTRPGWIEKLKRQEEEMLEVQWKVHLKHKQQLEDLEAKQAKDKEKAKEYYDKVIEPRRKASIEEQEQRLIQGAKDYRESHREQARAYQQRLRDLYPEEMKIISKRYRDSHREILRVKAQGYRARANLM